MDDRILKLACAIRMTCGSHERAENRPVPVVTVDTDPSAVAAIVKTGSAMVLEDGISPEAAGDNLKTSIKGSKSLPAEVVVKGSAVFTIDRSRTAGRLAGVAAVVTGSAQGFGRGIAEELARHGACVTIADVNDPLGEACAKELCAQFGKGSATYAHADVTSLQSTEEMIHKTVAAFGGVDLFIANAGVLKAGSLEEMDDKAFDLVTNVNYKAFFVGTKAASRVMKVQHAFDPAHYMDIIQINSKSGLQGSNKNFAYAGSKFGSIGLTQSFAMELVEFNIKVNSICPGNFFEGPLWSDPEKGLFVQYLRAGKVPGATSIEDVKQSYVSKVPMKRGCSPVDVSRAILYIREQEYETGQAVPVTGGQVMLN